MNTQDAIDAFGSAKALAQELGISFQAVYKWGPEVPPLRAYQIREILSERAADDGEPTTALDAA